MKERERNKGQKEGGENMVSDTLEYSRSQSSLAVLGQIHKDLGRGPDSTKAPLARVEVWWLTTICSLI